MAIQVKICGLTSAEAADAALGAGVDYAGLVFHAGSPRNLAPEQAASLAMRLRGRTRIVALVADAKDDAIARAMAAASPDFLQLHGRETVERVAESPRALRPAGDQGHRGGRCRRPRRRRSL